MTIQPNRVNAGVPAGGQFAAAAHSDTVVSLSSATAAPKSLGLVLSQRYFAAKEQMDAHDQNEWVRDVHEDHPEAAYAHVNIETDAGGPFTAGVDLYMADGTPIELDSNATAILEDDFDVDWDMYRHRSDEAGALCGHAEVFSLRSIQDAWTEIESSAAAPADPFAHLTGMAKAKAQAEYAQQASAEAAQAYVQHLTSEILVSQPNAARLLVSRDIDPEFGHIFELKGVINADGDRLDVDLNAIQDADFHDIHFDRHVGCDDASGQLYIDLIPAS